MPLPDGEIQRRLREYAEPTWRYRAGPNGEIQKELFDGEAPAGQGWCDSPALVGMKDVTAEATEITAASPKAARGRKRAAAAPAEPVASPSPDFVSERRLVPPYEQYRPFELNAELKRRTGAGMQAGFTKQAVIDAVAATDAAP